MNETPVNEPVTDPASPEARNKSEKSLSDRILGYAFLASIVVNFAWIAVVSHSNLFGGGSVLPQLHEKPIKVFKPIPVKPKPKQVKPPPPPPKPPKIPPKITPIQHPHPTPPRPRPTPTRVINVAHTTNTHAAPTPAMPSAPASSDQSPPNPGVQSPPSPPTPPAPPAPPAPTPAPPAQVAPPTPPAPPPPAPKPTPPPPPPPVVHPRNYTAIASQEAGPVGDYATPSTEGVDLTALSSTTVTITFELDENGHPSDLHVAKSSGNSDLDRACEDAVRQTKFRPAIQDHLKLRAPLSQDFQFGS